MTESKSPATASVTAPPTAAAKLGYEMTFDYVLARLAEVDFPDAARRLGFTLVSPETMTISFLGQDWRLSKAGGQFVCSPEAEFAAAGSLPRPSCPQDFNRRSVLCYYALSEMAGKPVGEYCLLTAFSHGVFKMSAATSGKGQKDWTTNGLFGQVYGDPADPAGGYAKFKAVAEEWGMESVGDVGSGAHKWRYKLLPVVPVEIVYLEPDEEFLCDLKVYWDKTAIDVFKFEPLAVLNGCFVHSLADAGRDIR
jgi:hypothetical protein